MFRPPSRRCPWPAASLPFLITAVLLFHSVSAQADTYIVHMDKSAMPGAFADHHAWYTSTLSAAATDLSGAGAVLDIPRLVYVYDDAIHGFSARLTPPQLEQLRRSRGFLSAYRDLPVKLDTTHTPEFLGLSHAAGIWPASHQGEGTIVGVVDTGVWPESASYRDAGMPAVPRQWKGTCQEGDNFTSAMCNRKLIGARYFNRGLLAKYPNLTISVNSPRDTNGHGTHTSSTAAGSYVSGASYFGYGTGTASGVAPRAHLAIYKAVWAEGSTASDALAAIDQAISDGVDVISLSLQYADAPPLENPMAIAAFAGMERGIFVSTSAGNDGPAFKSIAHGIPWALTVGASTVDRLFGGTVVLGDGTTVHGSSLYRGTPSHTKELPIALLNWDCDNPDLLEKNAHKIVVCRSSGDDSDLGFVLFNVRSAKVAGAIFITYDFYQDQFVKFGYPATIVSSRDAKPMLDYINRTSNPTARLRFRSTVVGAKPAPAVAQWSSRGPSLSCPDVLKPDLVAPGSLVLASYSPSAVNADDTNASFNIMVGTSMACPHAAGLAAMLRALHPDWSPAAIRSAMMTTANPLDNTGSPISDPIMESPASPLAMGSGQLDPNRAADPGLVYDAGPRDYVGLLCAMNYTEQQIRTIARTKAKYSCDGATLDLNYPSFIGYFDPDDSAPSPANGTVREFRRTVTNVAEGAWTYTAELAPMEGYEVSVRPNSLVFGKKRDKRRFTLRIVGHKSLGDVYVDHGWLNWVDREGKHVVRSPIVATTHNLPDDFD